MDNATGKKRKRKRRPKKKAPLRRRPCSFYRKFRISGAYSDSVRSFSEQLIRNQSLQKSVSIPPFPSSDSAPGSPAVSWRWREPALPSRSPLMVWPGPCPVPTHVTALQSALSRQRSSGSPLKTAWSAATSCPPLWVSWAKHLWTSSQPCRGLSRASRSGSPSFPPPTTTTGWQISISPSVKGVFLLSRKNLGEAGEKERPSFLRRLLDT